MKIRDASAALSSRDIFNMTLSPDIDVLKNHIGEIIKITTWLTYNDDEGKSILSMQTDSGLTIATNSQTFQKQFEAIRAIIDETCDTEDLVLEICSGTSKSGRDFITCKMA